MTEPALSILIVDDDADFRGIVSDRLARKGHHVTTAADGAEALRTLDGRAPDVAILDLRMPGPAGLDVLTALRERSPGTEVLILTGHGNVETAVEAMRRGAADFLQKPCSLAEIELKIQTARERTRLARENVRLRAALAAARPAGGLIGRSPAFAEVLDLVERVKDSDTPVLLQGESGTGKELVARALHDQSVRHDMPFVAVNCATLQESLLESELFGHKAGAYTGATEDKPGLMEIADGGTLFIDEIAEAAPGVQAKLLRVLETGEFRAVGDVRERRVRVRVVAATNQDLRARAESGRFRKDLYFRLHVVLIRLPALRERREDIPLLVDHFLARSATARMRGLRIGERALAEAAAYEWPGNVRELANCVERAALLCRTRVIDSLGLATAAARGAAGPTTLEQIEVEHIRRVLEATKGNVSRAAEILGISRRGLHRKINEHGLR